MHEEKEEAYSCPITLDVIPDGQSFVHSGTAFDATALYTYLLHAPHMTNPVNRLEFTRDDILRLESRMEGIYGVGCIVRPTVQRYEIDDDDIVILDTQDEDGDWFDEVTIMDLFTTVVENHQDDTMHVRVSLNVIDEEPEITLSSSFVSESGSDTTGSSVSLPPERIFNSLVDQFDDGARTRRLCEQTQLLSFLDFEGVDIVRRMLALSNPSAFHDLVWSNTHVAVMEAVVTYLRAETPDDPMDGIIVSETTMATPPSTPEEMPMNIHVRYSDEWITYRRRLQTQLRTRYDEVVRDMIRLSITRANTFVRSHLTMVREYIGTFPERDVAETREYIQRWVARTG